MKKHIAGIIVIFFVTVSLVNAGKPLFTIEPLTKTKVSLKDGEKDFISYKIQNHSSKNGIRAVIMLPENQAVSQRAINADSCRKNPEFNKLSSCILTLEVDGSKLRYNINTPVMICTDGNRNQCYKTASANKLTADKRLVTQ